MRKNVILGLAGLTLFFLVISVFYIFVIYTERNPDVLKPFIPFVIFSGFFIFLIGAILLALSLSRIIDNKYKLVL